MQSNLRKLSYCERVIACGVGHSVQDFSYSSNGQFPGEQNLCDRPNSTESKPWGKPRYKKHVGYAPGFILLT